MYIKEQKAYEELCKLREQAKLFLISEERFQRVNEFVEKAKVCFADACLHEELGTVRLAVFGVMYYLMDAVMLFHGRYFKRGTKRMLDELSALPVEAVFVDNIRNIVASKDVSEIRAFAKNLLFYAEEQLKQKKEKKEPSKELEGSYEEMYSNWRNKVEEAAEHENVFAAFMNLCNLQYMLNGISDEVSIGTYNLMEAYNPDCLEDNVKLFDQCLQKYEEVYKTVGFSVKRFQNVDAFVTDYLEL